MVAKCGRCGAESLDGTVFCGVCGERIVVGLPDGYADDSPYFAYQFFGETHTYTSGGWTIRYVIPQAVFLAFFLIVVASVGWASLPLLFFATVVFSSYAVIWMVLIHLYRAKGRPLDFGGSGSGNRPSAAAAESVEADFPGPSAMTSREDPDDHGRSYAMTPKRR